MRPFITTDTYTTPADTARPWLDRLQPNGRTYFVLRYGGIVLRGWWQVRQGRYDLEAWARSSWATLMALEAVGGRMTISGLDHVAALTGPAIFAANHMSALETCAFPSLIVPHRPMTYVVKSSLLRYPFFGPLLAATRPIAIGRRNPRDDLNTVMNEGSACLAAGTSLVLFPEATRRDRFEALHFNSLGVKLARRAGVPVIPVALKTDFWGNGRLFRDFGPLRRERPIFIEFGAPVDAGGSSRAAHQAVVDFIADCHRRWTQ